MRTILNNLKPLIAYWASFVIYTIISLLETFSYTTCVIISLLIYIILNILIGFTIDIKNMRWGIILFELQLLICAIIFSINAESSGLNTFASVGNIFYSTFFGEINRILGFALSILFPVLLLGIGFGLTKLKKDKSDCI